MAQTRAQPHPRRPRLSLSARRRASVSSGRLPRAKDVDGRLPWMVAQEYGHEELASYLFLRAELVSLRDSFSLQVQRARKGG